MDTAMTIRSCAYLEEHESMCTHELDALRKEGFWSRLRGLIGSQDRRVFVFERCSSIHTMAMSHAIDVAFLSRKGEVMKAITNVAPWSFVSCLGASVTIERLHSAEPWFSQNEFVTLETARVAQRKEKRIWQLSIS